MARMTTSSTAMAVYDVPSGAGYVIPQDARESLQAVAE